ncbi:MAG: hypothetical protein ACYSVY_28205 [Planctomycetota bacterium]|jgi:hypothetical protein
MMTYRSACKPNRRGVALQLLVLQAVAMGLAPIAHATSEVVGAERTIEAVHTSQCVPVHNETICTFTANAQTALLIGRVSHPTTHPHRLRAADGPQRRVRHQIDPARNGERAPPCR